MNVQSLQDIFNSDHEGLLGDINPEILKSKKHSEGRRPVTSKNVEKRIACQAFDSFKHIFQQVSDAIASKKFSRIDHISAQTIKKGGIFVLNGQLCYVADVYLDESREDGEYNQRVRLIFANGTESNMLVHSMTIIQYKYGNSYQLIIENDDLDNSNEDESNRPSGAIYVARIKEAVDEFRPYAHPHKIGFTVHSGAMRTKNSIKDTAFLCREVEIVAEWQTFGVSAHKIEGLIHAFFSTRHINILVTGEDGKQYRATEWFDVPLDSIRKAIPIILQGKAKDYKISEVTGDVVPKTQ